jgi:ElaB/YqjD/DUF883 family membrane-anchored ribosome-binding protein
MEAEGDKLMKELRDVMNAAEDLVKATAAEGSDRVKEMRGRTEAALERARKGLQEAGGELEERIRAQPLAAVGIAAAAGLVVGILLARK